MTIPNSKTPSLEGWSETADAINKWLADNPVISDDDQAREGKLMLDRGSLASKDLEDERDGQVRPLNTQVKSINALYHGPQNLLGQITGVLFQRLQDFLKAEEEKKRLIFEAALREKARLEIEARDAERREKEKLEDAKSGELDVDVMELTKKADEAFGEFEAATRAANLAERETKVRLGGGFTRALGIKKKKELRVVDVIEALDDLVIPGIIEEAILKAARAYRKANGKLPRGIEEVEVE